jgi:hypothetical protein
LGGVLAALAIAVLLFTRRQRRVSRNNGAPAL